MTRRRIVSMLSSRVISSSSHSRSLGGVQTLGRIGRMALFSFHRCQHYYESGHASAVSTLRYWSEGGICCEGYCAERDASTRRWSGGVGELPYFGRVGVLPSRHRRSALAHSCSARRIL